MPMSYMLTSVATIFANSSKMTTLIRVMDITTIVSHVVVISITLISVVILLEFAKIVATDVNIYDITN